MELDGGVWGLGRNRAVKKGGVESERNRVGVGGGRKIRENEVHSSGGDVGV